MRLRKLAIAFMALASTVSGTSSSLAGVADSPLPVLTSGGSAALLVFIVPGVMKVGNLETEFTCTSLTTATIKFAVEIFGPTGGAPLNDVTTGNGTATLASGATQTITTGGTAGLHEDVFISGLSTNVRNGSARIVSESKAIACQAYVADRFGTMRCGSGSTTNLGGLCTNDSSCGGAAGSCRTTPDSLLELKVITKKQRGE